MGIRFRTMIRGLLTLLLCGLLQRGSLAQPPPAVIPGTRVRLVPPQGFTPAEDFPGYGQESQGASIVVTELPGPYSELATAFANPAELEKRGMKLLQQEPVVVNGQQGLLLHVQQQAGSIEFLKWILLLGTEQASVLITATLPKDLEATLAQPLKTSLLTTQWDSSREIALTEGLNFTLGSSGELQPAKRLLNAILYTKGGVFPPAAIADPIFVAAPALGQTAIADPEAFARSRVLATESVSAIQIQSLQKIKIDDLNGYEIIAQGKDRDAGAPVTVYQAILFESNTYYLMQGIVGMAEREQY